MIYFSSDWHLSHSNVLKFSNRPFENVEQMNEIIFHQVIELTPGSQLYFIGDIGFNEKIVEHFFEKIKPRNIHFHWIIGNHDKKVNYKKFKKYCASMSEYKYIKIEEQGIFLCHYPMFTWHNSHYNSWLLYGHHHAKSIGTPEVFQKLIGKTLNVNLEFNDYKFWNFENIKKYMNGKPDNWDYTLLQKEKNK